MSAKLDSGNQKTQSLWVNGNLIFADKNNPHSWLDAWGPDVLKLVTHYIDVPVDDTTGNPTAYNTTLVGASTITIPQTLGGLLALSTGAIENNGVTIQCNGAAFQLASGKPCYFGIRIRATQATQSDFFVGLAVADNDPLGGVADAVYFEKLDGSTDINFVLEKNSTETTSASAVGTFADNTFITLEFYFDGTNIDSYVNNVLQTRLATTNLPDDVVMTPTVQFLTGAGSAITMDLDWLRTIQVNS